MLLQAENICKGFTIGQERIKVLSGVNLTLSRNDFIAVMGTSGSGKSTLLHILGTLLEPDSGSYVLNGKRLDTLTDKERSWIRGHWIGFVFQAFGLVATHTVEENIALPYLYRKTPPKTVQLQVDKAIEQVGLSHRRTHRPAELSGGEMQRVAIARAIAIEPEILLADEPTGNLDSETSTDILSLFQTLNDNGTAIILITHDQNVAATANRVMTMRDGVIS